MFDLHIRTAGDIAAAKNAADAENVRAERDRLLAETDWTQVADTPVNKAAWAKYRKALRDITDQEGFPHDVEWPICNK